MLKNTKTLNINGSYLNMDKTVNLTTVEATKETPCYLIDRILLDELLSKVTRGSLDDIKEDIKEEVIAAKSKEDLFTRLANYIYLDKIINMVSQSEAVNYNSVISDVAPAKYQSKVSDID